MPLTIDWDAQLVKITSPTTEVDAQVLHDFIEDEMATPIGTLYSAIIQPEGKIEDPVNPGIYSQIILVFNSPWQVQFWGSSGYTRIYGGKLVGGLNDQVVKATGTAGDITVLESPVDGLTAVVETGVSGLTASEASQLSNILKVLINRQELDPVTGDMVTYDDDDVTPLYTNIITDKDDNVPDVPEGAPAKRGKAT